MEYTIKALADLTGVTPRTLRWYDQKNLLKPMRITDAGYRIYGPQEVERLQTILFYRELGVSLESIRAILDDPDFDRLTALETYLQALETRRENLNTLILAVQKTILETKGEIKMSDREKFEAFKRRAIAKNEEDYGNEIRKLYGDEKINRSNQQFLAMTEADYQEWEDLGKEILSELVQAVRQNADPAGPEGRRIAELHRRWLEFSWGFYTPQAHAGIVQMYVSDPRFQDYYDREISGCAIFLRDAVQYFTGVRV